MHYFQWGDCAAYGLSNGDALKTHVNLFHLKDVINTKNGGKFDFACPWNKCGQKFSSQFDSIEVGKLNI